MSAEQVIALEAAMAELGALYTTARSLTALAADAERQLLPRMEALGAQLRRWVRGHSLDGTAIDTASLEVLALRSDWQARFASVRTSDDYCAAYTALAEDDQAAMARLIPRIFAGLRPIAPAPALYVPVSVSTGRRRPGTSPFLSAAEAAERVARVLHEGIEVRGEGGGEWEDDFPSLACTEDPATLDTPVAVQVGAPAAGAAVFAVGGAAMYRIFSARRLSGVAAWLATEAPDAWWEAYEVSYAVFRDALREALAARGIRTDT